MSEKNEKPQVSKGKPIRGKDVDAKPPPNESLKHSSLMSKKTVNVPGMIHLSNLIALKSKSFKAYGVPKYEGVDDCSSVNFALSLKYPQEKECEAKLSTKKDKKIEGPGPQDKDSAPVTKKVSREKDKKVDDDGSAGRDSVSPGKESKRSNAGKEKKTEDPEPAIKDSATLSKKVYREKGKKVDDGGGSAGGKESKRSNAEKDKKVSSASWSGRDLMKDAILPLREFLPLYNKQRATTQPPSWQLERPVGVMVIVNTVHKTLLLPPVFVNAIGELGMSINNYGLQKLFARASWLDRPTSAYEALRMNAKFTKHLSIRLLLFDSQFTIPDKEFPFIVITDAASGALRFTVVDPETDTAVKRLSSS